MPPPSRQLDPHGSPDRGATLPQHRSVGARVTRLLSGGIHWKLHRHLFVDELNLAPSAEWTDHSPAWRFVRISRGVAYWLGRAADKELASGEVIVVAPNAEGAVRASQLGEAPIHCFEFSPELLGGFFSLAGRHYFDAVVGRSQPPGQFLFASHPAAQHFSAIVSLPLHGNSSRTITRLQ